MSTEHRVSVERTLWGSADYRYRVRLDGDGMLEVAYFDQPEDVKPGQVLTVPLDDATKLAELIVSAVRQPDGDAELMHLIGVVSGTPAWRHAADVADALLKAGYRRGAANNNSPGVSVGCTAGSQPAALVEVQHPRPFEHADAKPAGVTPPAVIYLQCEDPDEGWDRFTDTTWCVDRVNPTDIKYHIAAAPKQGVVDKLRAVYEAARGLCFGTDWNKGTQALRNGYRQLLINAVHAVEPLPENAQAPKPGDGEKGDG